MLKINRYETPFMADEKKFRVTVETDSCIRGTQESRLIRQELLGYIAQDPLFSNCGGVDFHSMKLSHNGTSWFAEFEAILKNR